MVRSEKNGPEEALELLSNGIKRYATSKGASGMYNETLAQFWIGITNHAIQTDPSAQEFDQFVSAFSILDGQTAAIASLAEGYA